MKLTEAHAQLLDLGVPTFSTSEIATALQITNNHATKILGRLANTNHVARLTKGRWALPEKTRPFMLPEAITGPTPSYVSFYSALYHHGMIEQIPETVFAATLVPTRAVSTPLGRVSLHQMAPRFFTGYDRDANGQYSLATPEKAIVDTLYLQPSRSRPFSALPELELPRNFNRTRARSYLRHIESESRRTFVRKSLEPLLEK